MHPNMTWANVAFKDSNGTCYVVKCEHISVLLMCIQSYSEVMLCNVIYWQYNIWYTSILIVHVTIVGEIFLNLAIICSGNVDLFEQAKPETVNKVCEIVRKQLALPAETAVTGESKFVALGADSLDTVSHLYPWTFSNLFLFILIDHIAPYSGLVYNLMRLFATLIYHYSLLSWSSFCLEWWHSLAS